MRVFLFTFFIFTNSAFASAPQHLTPIASGFFGCSGLPAVTTVANGKVYAWCSDGPDEDAAVRIFDPLLGRTVLDWRPKFYDYYQCKDFYTSKTGANNGFVAFSCVSQDWKSYAVAIRSESSNDSTDAVFPVGRFWTFTQKSNQFISGDHGTLYINDVINGKISTRQLATFKSDVSAVSVVNLGQGVVVQAESHLYYYDTVSLRQKWRYSLPLSPSPTDRDWIGIVGGTRYVVLAYRNDFFGTYELINVNLSNGSLVARREWKYDPQHQDQMMYAEPSTLEISDDESVITMQRNGLPHGLYVFNSDHLNSTFQIQDDYDHPANFTFDMPLKTIIEYHVSKTVKSVVIHDLHSGSDSSLIFDDSSVSFPEMELSQIPYLLDANHLLSAGFGSWTTYLIH